MNYSHLWGHTYLVWTQAGFNQSLYHLYGIDLYPEVQYEIRIC